ncbi:hypothetical protein RFM99_11235 [Mesorhizobium sp. VK4C]|uniref:hypothetical protein n=1 Tax=Mesorhizobium captivum TaxID=3072319 RepID=UPI002A24B8E2|nr:hypothetical protein [Mesorhizobium sp. VK4C]MDX8498995.1 hypothetical protein [Mesorhizobium sp. VK4C]
MTPQTYRQFIAAPPRDRLDLFLTTANRHSAMSDFWVCWTLNVLYDERLGVTASPVQGRHVPYDLIKRFSGDTGAP